VEENNENNATSSNNINIEENNTINENLNIDQIMNEKKDESIKVQEQILPELKSFHGSQSLNKSFINFHASDDIQVGEK